MKDEAIANQEKIKNIRTENENKTNEEGQLEEKEGARKMLDQEIGRPHQEKEELKSQMKQKEIEEKKREQERNEEIQKIGDAHQNELLAQKRAADLQEIERQELVC